MTAARTAMNSRRLMSTSPSGEATPVTASESRARPMPRTLPALLHPRPRHRDIAEQRRHVAGPQLQDGDGCNPVVRLQDVVARILKNVGRVQPHEHLILSNEDDIVMDRLATNFSRALWVSRPERSDHHNQ